MSNRDNKYASTDELIAADSAVADPKVTDKISFFYLVAGVNLGGGYWLVEYLESQFTLAAETVNVYVTSYLEDGLI